MKGNRYIRVHTWTLLCSVLPSYCLETVRIVKNNGAWGLTRSVISFSFRVASVYYAGHGTEHDYEVYSNKILFKTFCAREYVYKYLHTSWNGNLTHVNCTIGHTLYYILIGTFVRIVVNESVVIILYSFIDIFVDMISKVN